MTKLTEKIEPRLNLEGFTAKEKEEIVVMVENIVREKIYISILHKLSHSEREELETMDENQYKEKFASFLDAKIPEFRVIIDASVNEVVKDFNTHRAN